MAAAGEHDPFEYDAPSPLPSLAEDAGDADPIVDAEHRLSAAVAAGAERDALVAARLSLAEAWRSIDAIGPALAVLREAFADAPDEPRVLEPLGTLLAQAGAHREAGEILAALARSTGQVGTYLAAGHGLARAEAIDALDALVDEMLRHHPDDATVRQFAVEVARARPGASTLVPGLLASARFASARGDAESALHAAADAWFESRGQEGGRLLAEVLLAQGAWAGALQVAVDAAARSLAAGARDEAAARVLLAGQAARAGEAIATEAILHAVAALLVPDPELREGARDLLAEAGLSLELSARLRAHARREREPAQAAAAWKGVAAVEWAEAPARAAVALGEALVCDPADREAREQLLQLADDPAVREALWWATRAELSGSVARRELLVRLGELEEHGGDPAAAWQCYRRAADEGDPTAQARCESLAAQADALHARADAALRALEGAPRGERAQALEALLEIASRTPGALRDLAQVTRVLAPLAAQDQRVADCWLQVTRRRGDASALAATLRRIATRGAGSATRARAAIELAELLDRTPEGHVDALELLLQLLDEQPAHRAAATTLAAIAEHDDDAAIDRAALLALARTADDPTEHHALLHLAGEGSADGPYAVFARAFDETLAPRARDEAWRVLAGLLGETPGLLARRTRCLLAQPSEAAEGLEVARRFALLVPRSPEATIAWFSAAALCGESEAIADAAVAVVHSLAGVRDAASVARAAVLRLLALHEREHGARVLAEAARALGLEERGLRALVREQAAELVDSAHSPALLEAALCAAHDEAREQRGLLEQLAQVYRARGDGVAESAALRRLLVLVPEDSEVQARLEELLEERGDRHSRIRVLARRLDTDREPTVRRETQLALAALHQDVGDRSEALRILDRYAEEQGDSSAHAEVMRALLAMGDTEAAIERLARWAEECTEARVAASMYRAAARLAHGAGDPTRALTLLRAGLSREPESPALLLAGEQIATEARLAREMLVIYDDLDARAAGAHGQRALAYRRAAFLEAVGDVEAALECFLALFEQRPVSGALTSAIERLARMTGRLPVLVAMHRRLAEAAGTVDGQVRALIEAARLARELLHDRRTALELVLQAHDLKRDEGTTRQVLETARTLRSLDPHTHRGAIETVIERTLEAAREVWDDALKRELALRAAEMSVVELADAPRCVAALEVFLDGAAEIPDARIQIAALLDRLEAPPPVREAVARLERQRVPAASVPPALPPTVPPPPPSPTESASGARDEVVALAEAGDHVAALARAWEVLARIDDEPVRDLAEQIAREAGDAAAELALIDYRLERTLDSRHRIERTLRAAELLRGPLARPEEARRRLEVALATEPEHEELLRVLHEVAEQLGAWDAVATLLARRIARSSERAETRALRLHRAAVLEQRLADPEGARVELEAILEDEPAHRAALRYLSDLHLRAGQFREAGECFAQAAASAPVRREAADLLGRAGEAFAQGGDAVAAAVQFARALELDARAVRALRGMVEQARQRGDRGTLERSLGSLAEATEDESERIASRLAAAREALEAGALFRAKSHLDSVRRVAPAEEVAALDAILQDARDNDRPISRSTLRAVPDPAHAPTVLPPPPDARRNTPQGWLAAPRAVPQPIEPDPLSEPGDHDPVIPLVARSPRVTSSARLEVPGRRSITPPPPPAPMREPDAPPVDPAAVAEPPGYADFGEEALRAAADHDDGAARALAVRLARTENGRAEALRLERQRFLAAPDRLEALIALVGLYHAVGRTDESRALRTVLEVLTGGEPTVSPPPLQVLPEPPPDAAVRMTLPGEFALVAEVGALLWDAMGNAYRREVTSYGVTGVDRILPSGPTDIARLYAGAVRLLQLPRTSLFVRAEVPGGVIPARTQPPAVLLAAPLANKTAVAGYMLGQALEATRGASILACTLEPDERATLVHAVTVAFAPSGAMTGASPAVGHLARELFTALTPRAQRRLQELLAELEAAGTPFTEALWLRAVEAARARAGLLVSGDFGVAARMVVARHRGGGEPDVRGALATLEPLRDLCRFAVSEQYLMMRWHGSSATRARW